MNALYLPRFSFRTAVLLASLLGTACNEGGRTDTRAQAVDDAGFAKASTALCGAQNNRQPFAAGPDRIIGLSEVLRRGGLTLQREFSTPTAPHSATDGRVDDWRGQAPRLGGLAVYDQGEHIYSDFLYDAWGADDGNDVLRYGINEGLQQAYPRVERLDQLFQALGDQFGAPAPAGASSHYGDDADITGPNDLTELRWAADDQGLNFYARFSRLTEDDRPALFILLDLDDSRSPVVPLGLFDTRYDHMLILERDRLRYTHAFFDLFPEDFTALFPMDDSGLRQQWMTQDFTNAVELSLPWSALGGERAELTLAVLSAEGADTDGDGEFDEYYPANLGYRYDVLDDGQTVLPCDPVAGIYNDRAQAFDLYNGNIDGYAITLDVEGMRRGRSQQTGYTGGYYERHFKSDPSISHEDPLLLGFADSSDPFEPYEQTVDQAYGLFLPYDYDPQADYPLTFWLHYQGGMTHSAGAWSPRIVHQHGQEQQNIVVTPRARGSKSWYVGASHQDIWEVFADVAGTAVSGSENLGAAHGFSEQGLARIDPGRVYLSGYSMGGYGTYMMGLMYPDKFAAAYSTSGVHFGDALPGGAHLLDNARNLPIVIHHGSFDELVPIVTILPVASTLDELGYRYRMDTFPGYEHYTHAITDEWAEGTRYLNQFQQSAAPRHITYKVVPELTRTINNNRATLYGAGTRTQFDFNPDGAWWIDDIVLRDDGGCDTRNSTACDDSIFGLVDAVSFAIAAPSYSTQYPLLDSDNGLGLPSTPVYSPGNSTTPYVRQGLDWVVDGEEPLNNGFALSLNNIASLTLYIDDMQFNVQDPIQGDINSDGQTRLRLASSRDALLLHLNGQAISRVQNGFAEVTLPAGQHTLHMRPN